MTLKPVLDFLRVNFAYFIAVGLPLAGAIMAIAKYTAGDREEGMRIGAVSVMGAFLWALLLY